MTDTRHRGLITVSIMLATIMQAVDTTIANVALPHMQGALSATQSQIAWVLTSYIVAAAIMTPATGFLSARFGRKRLFVATVAGFIITSMLCGAATSVAQIVIFRILQGLCGAALVPLSQTVLLDTYPREQHGSAMALWGVGVMVGPILGPTLGGYLTEYYNWRWTFYVNLPVGIFALLGILAFVPETAPERTRSFDRFGFAMLSLSIGALQLMLDRGELKDWFSSSEVIAEASVFGLCLYLFVVHSATAARPFFEPALFRDRNLIVGLFFIFIVGIILLATLALLPPFLQNLVGFSVLDTGYLLAPRGVGTMLSMLLVGRLMQRVDTRLLIFFGLLLMTYSLHQMTSFNMDVSISTIVITGIVQGIGLGLVFVPLSAITFATLAPRQRPDATALFSLLRNLGSSLGISVVVGVLAVNTQINHATLTEHASVLNPIFQPPYLPEQWNIDSTVGLLALNEEITRQATAVAYVDDFKLMMFVSLCAIPMLLLLRAPRPLPVEKKSAATT